MNIAFLNASITRKGGGIFEVERRLAQKLLEFPGVNVQVFGLGDSFVQEDLALWDPIRPQVHKVFGSNPLGFGYSKSLLPAIKNSNADLLHLHVLWMYPSVASLKSKLPYITTVHGMLDSWAIKNSRLKKAIAAALYEREALKKASCLHAFTLQEYQDIRKFGLKNPVAIIPNGVDVPKNVEMLRQQPPVWADQVHAGEKVLLYLGRIHPKKGISNLIEAWNEVKLQKSKNVWKLAIVGWGQPEHEAEAKQLIKNLQLEDQILYLGPQFNLQKDLCFAHADAFILPSFSEGLPMAILEAWSFGLPVLMSKECNLQEGFTVGAAIQIEPHTKGISDGLNILFSTSDVDLETMGIHGREMVIDKFNWDTVSKQMLEVYNWVLDKNNILPNTILLN